MLLKPGSNQDTLQWAMDGCGPSRQWTIELQRDEEEP